MNAIRITCASFAHKRHFVGTGTDFPHERQSKTRIVPHVNAIHGIVRFRSTPIAVHQWFGFSEPLHFGLFGNPGGIDPDHQIGIMFRAVNRGIFYGLNDLLLLLSRVDCRQVHPDGFTVRVGAEPSVL